MSWINIWNSLFLLSCFSLLFFLFFIAFCFILTLWVCRIFHFALIVCSLTGLTGPKVFKLMVPLQLELFVVAIIWPDLQGGFLSGMFSKASLNVALWRLVTQLDHVSSLAPAPSTPPPHPIHQTTTHPVCHQLYWLISSFVAWVGLLRCSKCAPTTSSPRTWSWRRSAPPTVPGATPPATLPRGRSRWRSLLSSSRTLKRRASSRLPLRTVKRRSAKGRLRAQMLRTLVLSRNPRNRRMGSRYVVWGYAGRERAQHVLPYDKPEPCAKVCCLSRVRTVFESLGKMWYAFPGHEVCENWEGSVKVCEFCGLQSTREKLSAHQSETAFLKTKLIKK